jgi:DNA-binding NarL/FixJ family response regulator
MKILIADDHAVLRKGLIQILADEFPDARFGEASSTSETADRLASEPWDALVLDIFMPGRGGLEVLQDLRRLHARLPVLVLSSAPEEQMAIRVLKAGASGYLNKQAAPEELVRAVKRVLAGGKYVSATVTERLVVEIGESDRPPLERLSGREYSVLHLLMGGKSIKEIASHLSLSPKTVSTFHTRIWDKLGVHSDVELIQFVIDQGMQERLKARD